VAHLQGLDRVYRKDQHHDFQQQAIPDPDNQNELEQKKHDDGAAQPELSSDDEA
jgi:hypothetical protein